MSRGSLAHLLEERSMLREVSRLAVRPHKFAGHIRIGCKPGNRIELVISHHAARRPRCNHGPHQLDGFHLFGASIDQIADEDRPARGMTVGAMSMGIAQMTE
jgi:hypothetical protein